MGAVVILMTLLVGLLSGLTAGLSRGSVSAITGLPADHLAFADPGSGQKLSFTQSVVTQQQWSGWSRVPGVKGAQPLGIAAATVTSGERTAATSVFGVQPGSRLAPDPAGVTAGSVILSTGAASALDAHAGDTVMVAGQRLTVTGVAGDASFSHTPVIWASLGDWQRLAPAAPQDDAGQRATVIALTTMSGADLAGADQRMHTQAVTIGGALPAIGSYTAENGSLQLMRVFLFAISALVIGAFFTVWTIQRSGDIAVLKALGATTRYLLRDALGQAVVLLVAGTAVGTALAAAAGAVASGRIPFVLDVGTVLTPALVIIVLGAAGAALSIRRITSVDPLTALGSAR